MTCIKAGGAIVTLADEIDRPAGADLRTRAGREEEVRQQVRQFGGFSVFWVTDNQLRAQAADRLIERGEIVQAGGEFPWCGYQLQEEAA